MTFGPPCTESNVCRFTPMTSRWCLVQKSALEWVILSECSWRIREEETAKDRVNRRKATVC